jgi:hypothetical protein
MYEFIGNVMLVWFSIGLYNYGGVYLGYKKEALANMALRNNVAHVNTATITECVKPHEKQTQNVRGELEEVTPPPIQNKWWWMRGGKQAEVTREESTLEVTREESTLEVTQYTDLKNVIDSSNCVTRAAEITKLSQYTPIHDVSNYITDISNCEMMDCIEKTAHEYTDFNTISYNIPTIFKNPVIYSCTNAVGSLFYYIGFSVQIEKLCERCLLYLGFSHCEQFDSKGTRVWTREVPNTEPIVFFPHPGIGIRFVLWGHYLKSLGRTVHIFGHSLNYNYTAPSAVSAFLSPEQRLDIFKQPIYLTSHDIIADSSRKIDAENYINALIAYKHFLTMSNVNGFEFKDAWKVNRVN